METFFNPAQKFINLMDKTSIDHRIGVVFLHDADSSGADISSFFSSIPLESFGDKSFNEVSEILGVTLITPTAQVRSGTDDGDESNLFWEWFAVSPDWRVMGLENTLPEDRESINISKQQVDNLLTERAQEFDYLFIGGFAHGGNMCLELLDENQSGPFHTSSRTHRSLSSLQQKHPKVIGMFTLASYLPRNSSILSHAYESMLSAESHHTGTGSDGTHPHPLPVLMMHGKEDASVALEWGQATASQLTLHDTLDVRFQTFPDTEHEIGEDQLHVLLDWMEATVNATKQSPADGILFQYEKEEPTAQDPADHFHIEPAPGGVSDTYTVTYPAQPDVVHALIGRPVLACGGMFDITEAANGVGVQCIVHSADPEKTATAIGERLVARIASHLDGSGNAGEDVCCIS